MASAHKSIRPPSSAKQATLIGDVRVGPQSSVWPGAVIRADSGTISIGRGSNVQDNSVIHADDDASIGDGVTIGHGVVCHAKNYRRRMPTRKRIGSERWSDIGKRVPRRSRLRHPRKRRIRRRPTHPRASPGKAIGKLRARHQELQKRAALSYVNRIERYKRGFVSRKPALEPDLHPLGRIHPHDVQRPSQHDARRIYEQ